MSHTRLAVFVVAAALVLFAATLRAASPPGKYPETSTRALAQAELSSKSLDELRIMRNEIFARHGHTFKTPNVKAYFAAQPWYRATVIDAGPLLSELERKNLALILAAERSQKSAAAPKPDALPVDAQRFWKAFRSAVRARDPKPLLSMTQFPFVLYIDSKRGRQEFSEARFRSQLRRILPEKAVDYIGNGMPDADGDVLRFNTPEEDPIDPGFNCGRVFRFERSGDSFLFVGTFITAGPGDGMMDPHALDDY